MQNEDFLVTYASVLAEQGLKDQAKAQFQHALSLFPEGGFEKYA